MLAPHFSLTFLKPSFPCSFFFFSILFNKPYFYQYAINLFSSYSFHHFAISTSSFFLSFSYLVLIICPSLPPFPRLLPLIHITFPLWLPRYTVFASYFHSCNNLILFILIMFPVFIPTCFPFPVILPSPAETAMLWPFQSSLSRLTCQTLREQSRCQLLASGGLSEPINRSL